LRPQVLEGQANNFGNSPGHRPLISLEASMHKEGEHVVESAVEARAGFLDRPVLIVLVVGSLLAAIFLVLSFAGVVKL
jgi:hypothetical protein